MNKLISILSLVSLSSVALAQTPPPPKEAMCRTCHGAGGAAPIAPSYPKLNGQNKDYLVAALKAYKTGARSGGLAAVMTGQSAQLSDAEIEALAAYYAAQE